MKNQNADASPTQRKMLANFVAYLRAALPQMRGDETTLEQEVELDPALFWQIHRSTIINVNAIAGVSRDLAGHLIVKLKSRKETLPVSQPFAHLFRQM
jgi:DNA-binding LytR/AlgR family response regulator